MDRAEYLESIGLHLGWNKDLVKCQICHDRWHSVEYKTCYDCRPPWLQFDRKEFSADHKIDIMERDNYQCAVCGTRDEYLQIDHIKPCAIGGEPDVWNGQVLCAGCNLRKASNWRNTQWPRKRIELMHFYLTFGWPWLGYEEQETLVAEASNRREVVGYQKFSGIVETSWLQSRSLERKIIILKQTPRALPFGEHGPLPQYVNIVDGWIEGRRAVDFGDRFAWHARIGGVHPSPAWAQEMADQQ